MNFVKFSSTPASIGRLWWVALVIFKPQIIKITQKKILLSYFYQLQLKGEITDTAVFYQTYNLQVALISYKHLLF